jgi:hypothetical protein
LGSNKVGIEKTIGNGRSKGSSIFMQRPVTMAHQKSFRQHLSAVNNRQSPHEEEDEEHYASAQSPMFQNNLLGDNNSVHLSTVPGTYPENPMHGYLSKAFPPNNESQLSSLVGTPRWQPQRMVQDNSNLKVPSQVVIRHTPSNHELNPDADELVSRRMSISSLPNSRSSHDKGNGNNCPTLSPSRSRSDSNDRPTSSQSHCSPDSRSGSDGDGGIAQGTDTDNRNHVESSQPANVHPADHAVLQNVTNLQQVTGQQSAADVPEWDGYNPDFIIKRLKATPPLLELQSIGRREFYKSYNSWGKMTVEQRNKTLSYFHSLPEEGQEQIMEEAVNDSLQSAQAATTKNTQTTKDDIIWLIHLFKVPSAQKHWCNLHRIMSRAELDSRKAAAVYNEASNPLTYLAEIYNDYEGFTPQNVMVQNISQGPNEWPIKKFPTKQVRQSGHI